MPETQRITGKRTAMNTRQRAATAPAEDIKLSDRWAFLASLGIEDLLAHWMITNLSESQFGSLTTTFSRPASKGVVEAKSRAQRSAAIAAACVRSVKQMSHLQAGRQGLTERELQKCKAKGIDPAKYAATKAAIRSRSR